MPAELRRDTELLRRARLLISAALAAAPIALALAVGRWLVEGPRSRIGALTFLTTMIAFAIPFIVRVSGALRLAATTLIGAGLATLTLMMAAERGLESEAVLWLPLVPIGAALLLGARDVLRWTVFALGALVVAISRDLFLAAPTHGPYVLRAVAAAGAVWFGAVLARVAELGRVEALEGLALRERRFRALIDGMPDALLRIDKAGRIVDVHLPREQFTLLPGREVLLGRDVATALPQKIGERIRKFALAPTHSEETLDLEGDVHLQLIVVRLDEGDSLALLHDVSALTAAERGRALSEQLATSVRQRDEFISVASHELRTPLTSMKLLIERVKRLDESELARLPGAVVDAHRRIAKQVSRLETLIDELLDVSRLLEGRLVFQPSRVALDEIVSEVASRFEDVARRAGSAIHLHLAHVEGLWDRSRIDQIVTNLISNAVKYGRGGPIEVYIQATTKEARLSVRDHGMGIDPSDHARIFERFERVGQVSRREGLGLGLWITKQLAVAMGGTIAVESQQGSGATFSVSLPLE